MLLTYDDNGLKVIFCTKDSKNNMNNFGRHVLQSDNVLQCYLRYHVPELTKHVICDKNFPSCGRIYLGATCTIVLRDSPRETINTQRTQTMHQALITKEVQIIASITEHDCKSCVYNCDDLIYIEYFSNLIF